MGGDVWGGGRRREGGGSSGVRTQTVSKLIYPRDNEKSKSKTMGPGIRDATNGCLAMVKSTVNRTSPVQCGRLCIINNSAWHSAL